MAIEQLGESLLAQAKKRSKKEKRKAYQYAGLLLGLKAGNYFLRKNAARRMEEFNNSLMPVIQNYAGTMNEANNYFTNRDKLLQKHGVQDYKVALRLEEDALLKRSQEYKAPTDTIEYSKFLDDRVNKKYAADQEKYNLYSQYLPSFRAGTLGLDLKDFSFSDANDIKKLPAQLQKVILDTYKIANRNSKVGGAALSFLRGREGQLVTVDVGGESILIPKGLEDNKDTERLVNYLKSVQKLNTDVELVQEAEDLRPLYKQPKEIQVLFSDKKELKRNTAIDTYVTTSINLTDKDIKELRKKDKNWKDKLPSLDLPGDDQGAISVYDIAQLLAPIPEKRTDGTTGPSNRENFTSALAYEATRIEDSKSAIDKNILNSVQEALSNFNRKGYLKLIDTGEFNRDNTPVQQLYFDYNAFKNINAKFDDEGDQGGKIKFTENEILEGLQLIVDDVTKSKTEKLNFILQMQKEYGGPENKELDDKIYQFRKALEDKETNDNNANNDNNDTSTKNKLDMQAQLKKYSEDAVSLKSLLGMDRESRIEAAIEDINNAISLINEGETPKKALALSSGLLRNSVFKDFLKEKNINPLKFSRQDNILELLNEFITLNS